MICTLSAFVRVHNEKKSNVKATTGAGKSLVLPEPRR